MSTNAKALAENLRFSSHRRGEVWRRVVRGRKNPLCYGCGARLRLLREAIGATQLSLSRASRVSVATISLLETQVRMIELGALEQLAAALSVSPSWVAYGPEGFAPFRQKRPRGATPLRMPEPELVSLSKESTRYRGLPDRMREARTRLGLTLRALERACGISLQAISCTEQGITVPKIQTLEAIAVGLDVAPGWLAFGETGQEWAAQQIARGQPAAVEPLKTL